MTAPTVPPSPPVSTEAAIVERLTLLDEAFLHVEHAGVPIHVGAIATFEAGPLLDERGRLRLDELRTLVASRLDALPRLRRRVVATPFGLARPSWVDDPEFDIARHVDAMALAPPGDEAALRDTAAQLATQLLDVEHPPWNLRFVTGLDGDRVALIERVHHALVDGVSGVDVTAVLLDLSPDPEAPVRTTWTPPRQPSTADLVRRGLREQLAEPIALVGAAARAVARPVDLARRTAAFAGALATVAADGVVAPDVGLNHPVSDGRRLGWVRQRLADVKAIGRPVGATANDVVLSAVAGGLRCLLLHRGVPLPSDLALKVIVPVSLRDQAQRGTLGNQVGALILRLPVGIGDPTERLRAVAAGTARVKERQEAAAADVVMAGLNLLPAVAVGPLAALVDRQPLANLIITNVPGPPVPLYLLGARMLEAFPTVPLGANFSLNVAILSYDGALNVSFTADAQACPDVDVLVQGTEAAFAELAAATF